MFAATAAVGIGNSLLMPTLSALASRSAESNWQGRALGLMQSSGSLARWVGPCLPGLLLSAELRRGGGAYALWPLLASSGCLFAAALAVSALTGRGLRSTVDQPPDRPGQDSGLRDRLVHPRNPKRKRVQLSGLLPLLGCRGAPRYRHPVLVTVSCGRDIFRR